MDKLLGSIIIILIVLESGAITGAKEIIRVSGSTTVFPLAEFAAEDFNDIQTDYQVLVSQGGTGVGITDIASGNSQIAMASREITNDEKSRYPGKNFEENLVGYDGIVIAVSRPIYDAGVTSLTKDQVKKIYSGEITNWAELGGPCEEILPVSRMLGSGTRDTFNEVIFGNKFAETPGEKTKAPENADMRNAIAGNKNAIGYLGFNFAADNALGVIALDGIKPTNMAIKNANYELNRRLYLDTYGDPKPGAKAFIDFLMGLKGQKIAEENGFVPI